MATPTSIARPYTKAAFEFAVAEHAIAQWEILLQSAAKIVIDPKIANLITNTRISSQQWLDFFNKTFGTGLNKHQQNFLRLIIENKRLAVLPLMSELFKEYKVLHEKAAEVQVTTAVPLDENYQQKLIKALTKFLKHDVTLHCHMDKNILGGAIIRVGDKVIDGSVRGQLTRLLEFATS